ncbi:MAG: hypothetical protein AAF281_12460 [Pseudomonadota bacterium]
MGRLIKYLFYLFVLASAGVAVFALVSDLPPPVEEIEIPVSPSTG